MKATTFILLLFPFAAISQDSTKAALQKHRADSALAARQRHDSILNRRIYNTVTIYAKDTNYYYVIDRVNQSISVQLVENPRGISFDCDCNITVNKDGTFTIRKEKTK